MLEMIQNKVQLYCKYCWMALIIILVCFESSKCGVEPTNNNDLQ